MYPPPEDQFEWIPDAEFPDHVSIALFVTAIIVISIGIVGNLGVLLVVARTPDMRTPMYLCLSSLSVSDIFVLLILPIIPLTRLLINMETNLGVVICYMMSVFDKSSLTCSVLIVLFISVERLIVVYRPLRAGQFITTKRTAISLTIIWLFSYAVNAGFITMTEYHQRVINGTHQEECAFFSLQPWQDPYFTAMICIFFFLPLIAIIVLNGFIIKRVAMDPPSDSSASEGTTVARRARRQAVVMIFIIVVLFIVCIAPFQVLVMIEIYGSDLLAPLTEVQWQALIWCSRFTTYINSAANPIVYNIVSSKFRAAMLKSLTCGKNKNTNASRIESASRSTIFTT
ncbi:thyrotropin-releasing hormone receptor-like [Liolophura sinensis]|uniref:thyrotropin-releasing hormone receptor-like n=1 Tax=Liolophura sinensis TaxID=3198878 RepID=UPI0031596674